MKNQKGFSAVILLLALVLVAIVSFTGYYVWNTQSNKKTNSQQTKTADDSVAKKQTDTTATKPADTTKYLVIKEWGVKIPLTDTIADTTYLYKNGYVYVSTDSLTKKYPECSTGKTTVYAYGRFGSMKDPVDAPGAEGQTYGDIMPNAPKVGSYYYYGTPAQALCNSNDATTQKEMDAAGAELNPYKDAFDAAIKNVQAL